MLRKALLVVMSTGVRIGAAVVVQTSTAQSPHHFVEHGTPKPAPKVKLPVTKAEKIRSAMSAAPIAVSKDATILDYPADPSQPFIELRKGTNGWTCLPDWNATPGNDPQCNDKVWMDWTFALIAGKPFVATSPGLAYMLAGGSDASNTDPFATEPKPGEDWMTSPPHVMLIFPGKIDLAQIPTDHTLGRPWVMFAGTPYEHIMMPVAIDHR